MQSKLQLYSVLSERVHYEFRVQTQLCEPCPHCGIMACGREDILWYERGDERIAVIFDGGVFDQILAKTIDRVWALQTSPPLPRFLEDWNSDSGWSDHSDYVGYRLDVSDLLATFDLISSQWFGAPQLRESAASYMQAMKSLALAAQADKYPIKIVRG